MKGYVMSLNDTFDDVQQETESTAVTTTINSALFNEVPKLGEVLPAGTYHFKLEGVSTGWLDVAEDAPPEEVLFGKQPYFLLRWNCQQEPHVGAVFVDFIDWVNDLTITQATKGDPVAISLLRKRLPRIKAVMEAAEYKPPEGVFDMNSFFATKPEVRIQLGVSARKKKVDGVLKDTGEKKNTAIRYGSIRKPF